MKKLATLFTFFSLFLSAQISHSLADSFPLTTEQYKIERLIHLIGTHGHSFVRNGNEYSAQKAQSHVQKKLDFAGSRVKTARQFIERIASKSHFTGRPYYVKFSDGSQMQTQTWLTKELVEIETNSNNS